VAALARMEKEKKTKQPAPKPEKKAAMDEHVVSGRKKRDDDKKGKEIDLRGPINSSIRSLNKGVFELVSVKPGEAHDWKTAAAVEKEELEHEESVDMADPQAKSILNVQRLLSGAGDMKSTLKTLHAEILQHMEVVLATDKDFLKWLSKLPTKDISEEELAKIEREKQSERDRKKQRELDGEEEEDKVEYKVIADWYDNGMWWNDEEKKEHKREVEKRLPQARKKRKEI